MDAQKFELGKIVMTRGVADLMGNDSAFIIFVSASLVRYENCDWGDLPEDDRAMNDDAVKNGDAR